MDKIELYLEQVCSQIKSKSVHQAIRSEICNHITEEQEYYSDHGETEENATIQALANMGDPIIVGKQLDKNHRPQTEWSIIILLLSILGVGIFVLYNTLILTNWNYHFAFKQSISIILGLALGVFFYFFDYRLLLKYSFPLYICTCVLALVSLLFASQTGGNSFISFSGYSVSLSYILLIGYLLACTGLTYKWQIMCAKNLLQLAACYLIALLMMMLTSSFSLIFILAIAIVGLIMMITIFNPHLAKKQKTFNLAITFTGGIMLLLTTILGLISTQPYIFHRFFVFLHPTTDPMGAGYVNNLIHNITGKAGLFRGLPPEELLITTDKGISKFILPEAHTDYIFSSIIANFGWIMAIIIVLIFGLLLCRMLCCCQKTPDIYGKFLSSTITIFLFSQIIISILMNLNLLPLVSMGLPFISYSGSMMTLNLALMGLFLSVYRQKDLILHTTNFIKH